MATIGDVINRIEAANACFVKGEIGEYPLNVEIEPAIQEMERSPLSKEEAQDLKTLKKRVEQLYWLWPTLSQVPSNEKSAIQELMNDVFNDAAYEALRERALEVDARDVLDLAALILPQEAPRGTGCCKFKCVIL